MAKQEDRYRFKVEATTPPLQGVHRYDDEGSIARKQMRAWCHGKNCTILISQSRSSPWVETYCFANELDADGFAEQFKLTRDCRNDRQRLETRSD